MRPDVVALKQFYERPLGAAVATLIGRRLHDLWPHTYGLHVAGLGYAVPYLDAYAERAASIAALMPASQGVIHWPSQATSRVGLVEEACLPLPDSSFDRVLLTHALEMAENPGALLREVWRVLASDGRLIVVVPNRRSIWSELERTPFGHGRPYSRRQLSDMLASHLLAPTRWTAVLHLPPIERFGMVRALTAMDGLGRRWWRRLGGVLVMEAEKQLYGGVLAGARRRVPVVAVAGPR